MNSLQAMPDERHDHRGYDGLFGGIVEPAAGTGRQRTLDAGDDLL
jgi:hypothetical protein